MATTQQHAPRASSTFYGGAADSSVDFSSVIQQAEALTAPEMRAVEVLQGLLKLRSQEQSYDVPSSSQSQLQKQHTMQQQQQSQQQSQQQQLFTSSLTLTPQQRQAQAVAKLAEKIIEVPMSFSSILNGTDLSKKFGTGLSSAGFMTTLARAAQIQDDSSTTNDGAESMSTTSVTSNDVMTRTMSMASMMSMTSNASSVASGDSDSSSSGPMPKRARLATTTTIGKPATKKENKSRYSAYRKNSVCGFCAELGINCGKVAAKCPNRPCNQCGRRHRLNRCRKIGCKHCPGDHLSSKCPIKIKQWARASVARRRERNLRGKSDSLEHIALHNAANNAAAVAGMDLSAPPLPSAVFGQSQ